MSEPNNNPGASNGASQQDDNHKHNLYLATLSNGEVALVTVCPDDETECAVEFAEMSKGFKEFKFIGSYNVGQVATFYPESRRKAEREKKLRVIAEVMGIPYEQLQQQVDAVAAKMEQEAMPALSEGENLSEGDRKDIEELERIMKLQRPTPGQA